MVRGCKKSVIDNGVVWQVLPMEVIIGNLSLLDVVSMIQFCRCVIPYGVLFLIK